VSVATTTPSTAVAAAASAPASVAGTARFVVQVGAFSDAATLREARAKVEKLGLKTYTQVVGSEAGPRTRVRLGPYASRDEADAARGQAQARGSASQHPGAVTMPAVPDLSWVDWALLGRAGAVRDRRPGARFVFECLSLIGWVVAWFAAQWGAPELAPHLPVGSKGSALNLASALALCFVAALVVWTLLARLIRL
jgi:hypothetical protein